MSLTFGIHLVRTGAVSADQLIDALEDQLASRPQLGQLALQEGLLTMSQLFEVLSIQRMEEKPFGLIAVDKGFLSSSQLALLLMKQREMELKVTDLLVEYGAVSEEELTERHAQWKRENRRRETFAAGRLTTPRGDSKGFKPMASAV